MHASSGVNTEVVERGVQVGVDVVDEVFVVDAPGLYGVASEVVRPRFVMR